MDFFSEKLGVTWWHLYQHHSCIKKSIRPNKKLANFMIAPPTYGHNKTNFGTEQGDFLGQEKSIFGLFKMKYGT
jgi:hypothetical protein